MKAFSDEQLVELARDKDTRAFEELVSRYHLRIFNFSYRMLGNREDAEDVTQEVFLRLARKLPRPTGESIAPWLYRVATTVSIDEARRRGRRVATVSDDETLAFQADSTPERQPERALEGAALQRQIETVLGTLPENYRAALVLRELQGLSYEEIATAMKIPRRQVDTIVFRARREFKARFSALEELSCADAAVQISALVDGELPEDEVALVRAHMRACPECRDLEKELRRSSMMVRALIPVLPSAALKATIIAKGGLALGAAAGIGSGLLAGKLASSLTTKATALVVAALLTAGVVETGVVAKGRLEQQALRLQMAHKLVIPVQAVREARQDAVVEISEGIEEAGGRDGGGEDEAGGADGRERTDADGRERTDATSENDGDGSRSESVEGSARDSDDSEAPVNHDDVDTPGVDAPEADPPPDAPPEEPGPDAPDTPSPSPDSVGAGSAPSGPAATVRP